MTTLILPVAGRSSRFPGMRPKWLLTMPSGLLMVEQAVNGLNLKAFERIILICLQEHIDKYVDIKNLRKSLSENIRHDVEIIVLSEPTASPAETVVRGCDHAKVEGPIFIKDCDNNFDCEGTDGNKICTLNLNETNLIDASNKSYIEKGARNEITNIVEKRVVSDTFCVGGYGFEAYTKFREHFTKIQEVSTSEVYISDVIFRMMSTGEKFTEQKVCNYTDWGTLREYRHFCRQKMTIFCDLDGVLFMNGSKFGKNGWDYRPIHKNISHLRDLSDQGCLFLIVTTSRPYAERQNIFENLKKLGVEPVEVICGLPHQKRILINDFSITNPYPSAIAVNLERDAEALATQLEHLSW